MAAKDKRIDSFRDEAMRFVTEHFDDMKKAFSAYIKEGNWDKAVALYMKMADKVIPSLPTQAAEESAAASDPEWKKKIDKAKKNMEK